MEERSQAGHRVAAAGLQVTGFRDPCPWREDDGWYLGIGSGFAKKGGAVLLYRSQDLRQWDYLHTLAEGTWNGKTTKDPVDSGEMWECPDFFPLDGKHVLLYSTERIVYWVVGSYSDHRFHEEKRGVLDYGSYYAPKSMLDAHGNRILWGWTPETRSVDEQKAAGWSGSMTLPRKLSIAADGTLRIEPIAAVAQLQGKPRAVTSGKSNAGAQHTLQNLSGLVQLRTAAAAPFTVSLRPQGETAAAFATIEYHPDKPGHELSVERYLRPARAYRRSDRDQRLPRWLHLGGLRQPSRRDHCPNLCPPCFAVAGCGPTPRSSR